MHNSYPKVFPMSGAALSQMSRKLWNLSHMPVPCWCPNLRFKVLFSTEQLRQSYRFPGYKVPETSDCLLTTDISQVPDHCSQNINPLHERVHTKPLVMIMEKDGSVVNGGEPVRRDPLSSQIPGVCSGREYLRHQLDGVLLARTCRMYCVVKGGFKFF